MRDSDAEREKEYGYPFGTLHYVGAARCVGGMTITEKKIKEEK